MLIRSIVLTLKRNWPAILVLSLVIGYLLTGFNKGLEVHDEGLAVYGADRILHGDMPYRDFWALYGPGDFYALALMFKLFGSSLLVERFRALGVTVAVVVLSYVIAGRFVQPKWALFAPLFIAIWLYEPGAGPDIAIVMLGLLSLLFLLNYLSSKRSLFLVLAGLTVGITALFRPDQGLLSLAATLVPLMLFARWRGAKDSKARPMQAWKAGAILFSAAAIVTVPVAVWLIKSVPHAYLTDEFFTYPVKVYPKVRSLPFPTPIASLSALRSSPLPKYLYDSMYQLRFYYPILVFVGAVVVLIRVFLRRKTAALGGDFYGMMALLAYGLAFLAHTMIRADSVHLRGAAAMAAVLMPAVVYRVGKSRAWKAVLWVLIVLTGFPTAYMAVESGRRSLDLHETGFAFNIERARGIQANPYAGRYEDLVRYIQDIVPEGGKIFVGNMRHDLIFANDSMLYFLANRQCATRYNDLVPGTANTEPVQRQIISDIQRNHVKLIVLRIPWLSDEPNDSRKSTGVIILDQFIRRNYRFDQQYLEYSVLLRKAAAR